jgi:hypothetical protein
MISSVKETQWSNNEIEGSGRDEQRVAQISSNHAENTYKLKVQIEPCKEIRIVINYLCIFGTPLNCLILSTGCETWNPCPLVMLQLYCIPIELHIQRILLHDVLV